MYNGWRQQVHHLNDNREWYRPNWSYERKTPKSLRPSRRTTSIFSAMSIVTFTRILMMNALWLYSRLPRTVHAVNQGTWSCEWDEWVHGERLSERMEVTRFRGTQTLHCCIGPLYNPSFSPSDLSISLYAYLQITPTLQRGQLIQVVTESDLNLENHLMLYERVGSNPAVVGLFAIWRYEIFHIRSHHVIFI